VASRHNLGGVNRAVALVLALVWLFAGVIGITVGFLHDRFLLLVLSLAAIAYAVLWLRVVVSGQLLTWRELASRWRR